nr:capsid protein [Umbelopsis ramanniana virus 7]
MAKLFIKDNIKTNLFSTRDPIFPGSRFTVANNSTIAVKHQDRQFLSGLSLTADFQAAGRIKKTITAAVQTNYSGFNKKYINEAGIYDGGLALDEFAKNGADRGLVRPETYGMLTRYPQADSHESFIYNMLISYLKAKLSTNNLTEDEDLVVKTSPYVDSHCVIPLDQGSSDFTYEIELGSPVDGNLAHTGQFNIRNKDNYWSKPYVLHYNGTSIKAESFYLLHSMGRNVVSALNFDFEIKGADTPNMLIDPVNGREFATIDSTEVDWTDHETMWLWILDYVQLNRLEQAFAAAFETLGALAFQPLPPTAEACQWQQAQMTLTLARFSPTRARIRSNLSGEPYKVDSLADEFLISETASASQFLGASAICNYYMWYGLYTILQNESSEIEQWRNVYTSVHGVLQNLYSPAMRAMCISVATGKEFATCMTDNCAMFVDMSRMEVMPRITNIHPLDSTMPAELLVDHIPAPVSGAIVLGTFTDEYDTTSHLASVFRLPVSDDPYARFEETELLKIATVYRLFGYDTELVDVITDAPMSLWAANRECIPDPSKLLAYRRLRKDWIISDISPREGRKEVIDSIQTLTSGQAATVTIQQPTISFTEWRQRVRTLRPQVIVAKKSKKKEIRFKVNASVRMLDTTLMARPIAAVGKQDFRRETQQVPPVMPEEVRVEQGHAITAPGGVEASSDVTSA